MHFKHIRVELSGGKAVKSYILNMALPTQSLGIKQPNLSI
ncbi:12717_t:CDS:2 [Acaulospora morrowiae]|uniref:12717_t:CDS:1 n=1 Tax=Acaulospora morrowiae TaxID=94023 RepID=A0A9N8YL89_9GLOM|nr:12717_t:CDS:2 [Acaulospora morrowiae]